MKFPMIHADGQGETHFAVGDIPDREVPFGLRPNPTGRMTDFGHDHVRTLRAGRHERARS